MNVCSSIEHFRKGGARETPEDQTKDIKADMTLFGGRIVFQRRAAAPFADPVRT
jgi:hypothetical protein